MSRYFVHIEFFDEGHFVERNEYVEASSEKEAEEIIAKKYFESSGSLVATMTVKKVEE